MKNPLVTAVVCLTVFVGLVAQDGPETVVRGTKQFRQREVVTGLAGPWELTWGQDNMLWVTERTGKHHSRESGKGRAEGGGDDR